MKAELIIKHIEKWAPPGAAWKNDNVGLQIGSGLSEVTNIFLCLELSLAALKQAIKKNCNFIITHHPFIFKSLKRITPDYDEKSAIVAELIKNNMTVYSAHTNLDFTKEGVSFTLANKLGLTRTSFLENESENQLKVVVFVPANTANKVAEAIFEAGGGIIGDYSKCSYSSSGFGTFYGNGSTNPAVGSKEVFEKVDEIRLEVLVDSWNINKVLKAINKAHPYEEPAYDVYPLLNKNVNYGYGVIGELTKSLSEEEFLNLVADKLNTKNIRYCKGSKKKISSVAVCGGSGADLISSALAQKADAYVTADIKYHSYQDAENKMLLIDAGHYETEILVLDTVKSKLETLIKKEKIKIFKYTGSTNPVRTYNYIKEK